MRVVWRVTYTQSFKGFGEKQYTETIVGSRCLLATMKRLEKRALNQRIQDNKEQWHDCIRVRFDAAERVAELD